MAGNFDRVSRKRDATSTQLLTANSGSGLYDQAFSESVLDEMDFNYYGQYVSNVQPPAGQTHGAENAKWYCVDGGTSRVPRAMNQMLNKPLVEGADGNLNKRVTKIAFERKADKEESAMKVRFLEGGQAVERDYMAVFATPTLACLQRIDLTELELLYEQKDAIRSLHYDTATKVGMRFKDAWVSPLS